MDVLSEVLKSVSLDGAVFYNAEFSAPWGFRSPHSNTLARYLAGETRHVIIYHLVVEGEAWARVEGGDRVGLTGGDIVIFPHGDPHLMGNGSTIEPVDNGRELQRVLAQGLETARMGGGGEITRLVCGYMTCDPRLSLVVLSGLPPLLKVAIRSEPSGVWLENSIRFMVAQAASSAPGAEAVLAKLSEALFAETLRRYAEDLTPGRKAWLAGARDPQVGKALALVHRHPERPWSTAGLAAAVGASRAVLAERFRECLGQPPIGYLTQWRLNLGARLLTTTTCSVAEVAAQVGYESEAAFNRAFKRSFAMPPARFRKQAGSARAAGAGADS